MNAPFKSQANGLFGWFADNHIAANLLMLLLTLCGAMAAMSTTVQIFPEIDPETITVNVPYPGSTPSEVEESINRRIEEAITGIEGIEKVRSVAAEGAGTVTVELEDKVDKGKVLDDITSAVSQIQSFPPEDAEDPRIEITTARGSAITIALYGQASERSLRELAYRIRDELTSMDAISIAEVEGVRDYEIGIELSESALRQYGLTFEQVARAVRAFSVQLPGGTLRTDQREILLRANGQAYRGDDFAAIVLTSRTDGTLLRLGDVAQIVDGFVDSDVLNLFNGEPAAFVTVSRIGDEQVLAIEASVQQYVEHLALPPGIHSTTWSNRAENLRDRMDLLLRNGLMGLMLVFAVLVLFLNLRLAFWTTMGIPISFLGAFVILYSVGATINMISLFAFILVLGVVVDDAIIIGENIYAKREQGLPPLQAAIDGLHEVIVPVSVGIFTTILAFIPLLFTTGFLGKILWVTPVVVISVLLMSLIEASLILPAHLSGIRPATASGAIPALQARLGRGLQALIERMYLPCLRRVLDYPYLTVAGAACILMLAVGAMQGGYVESTFFPKIEGDTVSARLRMPSGTPARETETIVRRMLAAAEQTRQHYDQQGRTGDRSLIRNISASVGSTPFSGRGGPHSSQSSSGAHFGEVKIELLRSESRPFRTSAIEADWRTRVGDIPGAELTFNSSLLSAGDDINVELAHADFQQLLAATRALKTQLSALTGVVEIKDSFEPGKPELQLAVTDAGLAAGLTLNELARQVRQAFYGAEAQRVQRGRDDIKVLVRYTQAERRTLDSIYKMRIRLQSGVEVPFHTVARVREGRGFATIDRAERRRIVSVSAKIEEALANTNAINQQVRETLMPALKRDYPSLFYSFEGIEKERQDSIGSLSRALALALLAIFGILAVQLRSYSQPLIIMSVIPLGFVGAAIGHALLDYPLSFFSMFGLVALSGVVINDSLILMDLSNRLRAEGLTARDAILAAGHRRFRPILFTTLTTCAGLGPIISETSTQAQFLIPMAISLAFGVAFATLITLVTVPALYMIRIQLGGIVQRRIRHTAAHAVTNHPED